MPVGVTEAGDNDDRNLAITEQLCGQKARMPGKDHTFLVDEDRIGPAEPCNAIRELADLLFRMSAGVSRISPQLVYWKRCNLSMLGHRGLRTWSHAY